MIHKKFIELNYHGPFEMGNWSYNDTIIGPKRNVYENKTNYEEFLNFFTKNVNNFLNKNNFSPTLLDVGGYDGYFCNENKKKNIFSKITLLEPRKRNVEKTKFLKKFLNLDNNVKIINGTIDNVNDKFDVVSNFNVVHHLHEIDEFIKNLALLSKDLVVVSTIVFKFENKFLQKLISFLFKKKIEQKDICYNKIKKKNLFSVYKYESNYYDGSTIDELNLVSYPNPEYLEAIFKKNNLKILNLKTTKIKLLNVRSVFNNLYILKKSPKKLMPELSDIAYSYEIKNYVNFINNNILEIIKKYEFNPLTHFIALISGKEKKTIIKNFIYNYSDKIDFEIAKNFLLKGSHYASFKILIRLIKKLNCDTRIFNRSIVLLIFIMKSKKKNPKFFVKFCNTPPNILNMILEKLSKVY